MGVVAALAATEIHIGVLDFDTTPIGNGFSSFGLKLLWLAQASINVPSTVKCSSLK